MNESNIDSCSLSYNRFVHDIREKTVQEIIIFIIFQMLLVIYFLILIIVYTVHFFSCIEQHVGNLLSDDDENDSYIFQILKQSVLF